MAELFRYRKSRDLKYNEQGLIYFVCRNFKRMPGKVKAEIRAGCIEVCGDYGEAVFQYITTDKSFLSISQRYYISEYTLAEYVRKFYRSWEFSEKGVMICRERKKKQKTS